MEGGGEGIEVAAGVGFALVLFGCGIALGTDHCGGGFGEEVAGDAEVDEADMAGGIDDEVGGFEIAVDDGRLAGVEVVQGICDLEADRDDFLAGELVGGLEFMLEGFALYVFHDQVVAVGIAEAVVDGGDMFVGEGGKDCGFALEGLDGVLTFLVIVAEAIDHFGDDAEAIAEVAIAGEVDDFLAPFAEEADDLVATEEDIAWGSDWIPSLGIGHGGWLFAGGDFGFGGGEDVLGEEGGAAVTEADGGTMGEGELRYGRGYGSRGRSRGVHRR